MPKITLPANGWRPRPYQMPAWLYLDRGGLRASLRWHRRAGKDELCLQHTARSMLRRVANYWHLLPEATQARKAMWQAINPITGIRRIDEIFPVGLRSNTLEHEMMIRFKNGSTWQVGGSDNFNSLVGAPPAGIVFSEFSKAAPGAWAKLSPILVQNGGWAAFPTTPEGKNHAHRLHEAFLSDPAAFAETVTAYDTDVFTRLQLDQERAQLIQIYGQAEGEALFQQEYLCSVEAAVIGAVFGGEIAAVRAQNRHNRGEHVAGAPVFTSWDIGRTDATAIWFWQVIGGEVRLIDYEEDNLQNVDYFVERVVGRQIETPLSEWAYGGEPIRWGDDIAGLERRRRYNYAMHYLPHDAKSGTLISAGKTFEGMIRKALVHAQVMSAPSLQAQVSAGRALFKRAWFAPEAAEGLELLSGYKYKYSETLRRLSCEPVHDFTSHCASAWMTAALAYHDALAKTASWAQDAIKYPKLSIV